MALAFPLPVADFWGCIPFADPAFDLPDSGRFSRTRGGEILTSDYAERLWMGETGIVDMNNDLVDGLQPILDLLRSGAGSFLAHAPRKPGPLADKTGAILGAASVTLHTVTASGREVRLDGLPAGYVISAGDMLGWTYGADPLRYALHRVVVGAVADGAGLSPLIEVVAPVRAGYTIGAAVVLRNPVAKFKIVPGSVSPAVRGRRWTRGLRFAFTQTLR